jgi:hypothetical protein
VFVWYEYKNFPPGVLGASGSGYNRHHATIHDLVWAAATVGRKSMSDVLGHGAYSWFELMYRTFMVWANLRLDRSDNLRRTSAYRALDRSEKTAVSYFLGQCVAKLFASRFLGVRWLQHMTRFSGGSYFSPDLIGKRRTTGSINDWAVVEAKGRSGVITAKVKKDALSQAKLPLRLVHRTTPVHISIRVASVAYFRSDVLKVYWEDPAEDEETEVREVHIDEDEFIVAYYQPLASVLFDGRLSTEQREVGNRSYLTARIQELDLAIGLEAHIADRARQSEVSGAFETVAKITDEIAAPDKGIVGPPPAPDGERSGAVRTYDDGVLLELGPSWEPQVMRLEPEERPRIQ